jgi:hypothetical protein
LRVDEILAAVEQEIENAQRPGGVLVHPSIHVQGL